MFRNGTILNFSVWKIIKLIDAVFGFVWYISANTWYVVRNEESKMQLKYIKRDIASVCIYDERCCLIGFQVDSDAWFKWLTFRIYRGYFQTYVNGH